jgi:hypothetical protein
MILNPSAAFGMCSAKTSKMLSAPLMNDERFPHEAGSCVVEYPYSFQPVGENDRQGVHFLPVAAPLRSHATDLLANSYPLFPRGKLARLSPC